jgi:homoaconitate hydratase
MYIPIASPIFFKPTQKFLINSTRYKSFIYHYRFFATETNQTLIEKIVQKYALNLSPGSIVKGGDFVTIQPEHVMTHDNTAAVMTK